MSEPQPIEPGYYANDVRRLSFAEFRRLGASNIIVAALFYLFRGLLPAEFNEGQWLPQHWDDLAVDSSELTQDCLDSLLPQLAELERQGFYLASYHKLTRHLYPLALDNGAAFLLHPGGEFFASVIWGRNRQPPTIGGELRVLTTAIVTSCVSGKVVSVGNSKMYMDPPPLREVVLMKDASVTALWERAQAVRQRLDAQGEKPLLVRSVEDLKHHYDNQETHTWHDRINVRKVLVRMTNEQIETALQRMTKDSG
jgi:hypothetical protein